MSFELYSVFFITIFVLILVPGPSAMTAASHGAAKGSRNALWGVLGIATADTLFFVLSATGIATLIIASSLLFSIIKWLGVLYLFYLGFSAFFNRSGRFGIVQTSEKVQNRSLFKQGLIVQLANPKALMFFTALLPQFIDIQQPIMMQLFIMGITCFVIDVVVYTLFAYFGSRLSKGEIKTWVVNLMNKVAGGFLIFVGLRMATLEVQN